ncbi:PQQ-dependent sugar dehydrogenase [Pseudooceanicola sp.]|uniref:PQQ-dependent sugar dehydrogenase n=1 Tax=Pseudooceanicola sp. TaxID=1914328 RepID=UPI00261EC735|nr:PQQ-dependent sugar dehydrogenase [Pseudooceanicola sp.]MDF1856608.1 PQQ-dependent sugar dehydrogenase [Pseudooceanicola sp.]
MRNLIAALIIVLALPETALALDTSTGPVRIEKVADGLRGPWAIGFLPDGGVLVTEKRGRLWHIQDGRARRVAGLPEVAVQGQGGLLDILVPRDFAESRQIYLTHAKPQAGGSGTALSVGRLSADGTRLTGTQVIVEMTPGSTGGKHFGSRLVEGRDGKIYMSVGERGDRPAAQDLSRHNGSILRLNRDGTAPGDNPFVDHPGAQPEIWSYGHRNPQGLAMDAQGRIWANEHGARGGDEVNLIAKGANYGWPIIAYGRHYSGSQIGEGTAKPGLEQPVMYWDPSIAPSGMAFHSGKTRQAWRDNAFVGSLKFDYIARLAGSPLAEVERIESPETRRVRDIREGPDGAIWFLSEDRGALYRMVPE